MVTRDTDFSPKRTRRDFLASGIVGLAGSTIFAGRGNGIHPNSSADSPVGPLPSEDAGQNNPGKAQRAAGGLYWWFEDAARLPADPSYYRRVIDFCHDWKLNGCVLSLTDDQGCALKFKSHPELITHKNALTDKQAKALADYAQQQGVDLVPLIESFGHTRYITDVPQYAYLEDRMPGAKHNFSSVSPVASETLKLISDLYREAAEIFPAPYLHGDCDEVNWGGSELSRKALKTKSRDEIWANYINYLDHAARGVGKQFIISGDNVVHKRPEILPRLNKDIIVMDWHYYATAPEPLEQGARKIIGAGLRAIGGASLISCRWGPRAGTNALRNIDAYADAYRNINSPGALGVIVTNWYPARYIQCSLWDGIAYAGVALTEGSAVARESAFRRFVERFYQTEWNENWSDIFTTFYEITPYKHGACSPSWVRPFLPVPWRNDKELTVAAQSGMFNDPPFRRLLSQLVFSEAQVRDHFEDFLAFRLSVEYLEHIFWRNTVLVQQASMRRSSPDEVGTLIRTIAERDRRLLERLEASWDKGRPSDAKARTEAMFDCAPNDQLLYTFQQAAAYSQQLSSNPEHFAHLLAASV